MSFSPLAKLIIREASSSSPETTSTPTFNNLPQLPYTLRTRIISIAIVWSILITITSLQIEFFYFILRYATSAELSTAFTVPTAILLGLSILTIGYRTWLLVRRGSSCRPAGGKWWNLDFFHINALVGFVLVTAVLSTATEAEPPKIRQASMPQTIIILLASSQLVLTGLMSHFQVRTPISLSSTLRGQVMRPGIFVLIEDIVAVDGGGGLQYREALVRRYEASPVFKSMLARLNWFWGVGGLAVAGVVTGIIFGVEDENVVFALGWSLPWVWAVVWAALTVWYAQRMLRIEEDTSLKQGSGMREL